MKTKSPSRRKINKKLLVSLATIIISAVAFTVSSFSLNAVETQKTNNPTPNIPTTNYGYNHVDFELLDGGNNFISNNASVNPNTGSLPSSYALDSRLLTPVKNQGIFGTCWAFSTTISMESNILKNTNLTKDEINLSELHLAYYTYNNAYDEFGLLSGDYTSITDSYKENGSNFLTLGGNILFTPHILSSLRGAVDEYDSPEFAYNKASTKFTAENHKAYSLDSYYLHDFYYSYMSNRDRIKRYIMDYGAVSMSYHSSSNYFNYDTNAYCFIQSDTLYSSNHAVAVVGWDDNYSKENFLWSNIQPKNNGAWLVRNSWGSDWGDNGYFWLSYEDTASAAGLAGVYVMSNASNYDHVYQYDGSASDEKKAYGVGTLQIGNIFTAESDEYLRAVSFWTGNEDVNYKVYIFKDVTGNTNPANGTCVNGTYVASGKLPYIGYHTIDLDTPIELTNGEKFSVVIELKADNYVVQTVYVDKSFSYSWIENKNTVSYGQSFQRVINSSSNSSTSWYDCATSNHCQRIKAFTTDEKTNAYTTKYYIQDANGKTYSLHSTEVSKVPLNVNTVAANIKNITGYTVDASNDKNILSGNISDGNLILKVYYKTSYYNLSISDVEGLESFSGHGDYPYGSNAYISITIEDGYEFNGWSNGKTSQNFYLTVISDITLEPQITPKTYKLTYYDPQNVCQQSNKSVTFNRQIGQLPSLSKSGYRFLGWYSEKMKKYVTSSTINTYAGNQTLTAKWEAISTTVTFNSRENGASNNDIVKTFTAIEEINPSSKITSPVRTDWEFVGWNTNKNARTALTTLKLNGTPITLYAIFKKTVNSTLIYFNGSDISTTVTQEVLYNKEKHTLNLSDKSIGDYESYGWTEALNSIPETYYSLNYSFEITENKTFYALYKKDVTLTYDVNSIAPVKKTLYFNSYNIQNKIIPTFNLDTSATKEDYNLIGWKMDNQTYQPGTTVSLENSTTAYAIWDKNQITVTLNPVGGTVNNTSVTLSYDSKYGTLPTPTKPGYIFEGWYYNSTKITSSMSLLTKNNHTLVAGWKAEKYTLTYDYNGGAGTETSKEITYNSVYGALPIPTRYGFAFEGWYTDTTFTTEISSSTVVTTLSNQTIYAKWSSTVYTVQFNANGGKGVTQSQKVTLGEVFNLTENGFTKTGYDFIGWSKESTATTASYSNNQQVVNLGEANSTVILYAVWSPKEITVTLNANNGSCSIAEIKVYFNSPYSNLPIPTRKGYDFTGWYNSNNDLIENSSVMKEENDQVLTANWEAKSLTVTFVQEKDVEIEPITVKYDSYYDNLPKPSVKNYILENWYEDEALTKIVTSTSLVQKDYNHTLYGKWQKNTYTIKFDANGGTGSMEPQELYCDENGLISKNLFTKEGYIFVGWGLTSKDTTPLFSDCESVIITTDCGAVLKLYAIWKSDALTVELDPKGGECNIKYIHPEYNNYYGTIPTPKRTNYIFAGWFDNENNLITENSLVTISTNHILTAKWIENSYFVMYYENGGTGTMEIQKMFCDESSALSPNAFERDGYKFLGWSTDSDDTSPMYSECEEVILTNTRNNIISLYAIWEEIPTIQYTVEYYKMKKDGSGYEKYNSETRENLLGSTVTVSVNNINGFTFNSQKSLVSETLEENLVLKVYYDRNKYTLKFTDGSTVLSTQSLYFEQEITNIPSTSKDGFNFKSWDKEIPNTMPAYDLTINGSWEEIPKIQYTVEYYKMKKDGNGYEKYDSENHINLLGNTVTVSVNDIEGFTFNSEKSIVSATLTKDLILKVYYDRNKYTLKFTDIPSVILTQTLYFEQEITNIPSTSKDGYTFKGWDKEIPNTMPASDLTINGTWEKIPTVEYIVEYYKMKKDGSGYEIYNSEFFENLLGSTVTVSVNNINGFTFNSQKSLVSATLTDHLILKVYYDRNKYTLKFTDGSTVLSTQSLYFEQEITNIPNPSKDGYKFKGWDKEIPNTMPTSDLTINASWEKIFSLSFGDKIIKVSENEKVYISDIPVPEKNDSVFLGWFSDPEFKNPCDSFITPTANSVFYPKYISIGNVEKDETDRTYISSSNKSNGFEMYGVQVRLVGNYSMRFVTRISKQIFSDITKFGGSNIDYGSILFSKEAYDSGTDISLFPKYSANNKRYLDFNDYFVFTTLVENIAPENYSKNICIIPYISYVDANGITRYIYCNESTNSSIYSSNDFYYTNLVAVAICMIEGNYGLSDEQIAYLEKILEYQAQVSSSYEIIPCSIRKKQGLKREIY